MKHFVIVLSLFLIAFFNAPSVFGQSVSVAFVLDESGSVSTSNFNLETEGFRQALSSMPQDGSVEISIIGFSSGVTVVLDKQTLTPSTFLTIDNALLNNPKNSGSTRMSAAIDTSSSVLLNSSSPSKVLCLATDGQPNSATSTRMSAENARNAGINVNPIGIGLSESGKTFLDTIATNPPVANPSDFTDFATVVVNECVGVAASSLNLALAPDVIEFGSAQSGTQQCTLSQNVGLINRSTRFARVTNISIEGEDASAFTISEALGQPISAVTFPQDVPGQFSTTIRVDLTPSETPADGFYNATLAVDAEDQDGVSGRFLAPMRAAARADCLTFSVRDASGVVAKLDANDQLLTSNDLPVTEQDVQGATAMAGLVADGNARLFLTAETSLPNATIRFEFENPGLTEASLGSLDNSSNNGRSVSVDIPVDSAGFATAVLRAGERFLGARQEEQRSYKIAGCILTTEGNCSATLSTISVNERRAPVILIHGWTGNDDGWRVESESFWVERPDRGVEPALLDNHFNVGFFEYEDMNTDGPSEIMTRTERGLFGAIEGLCATERERNFSCTRSDLVAHSMGGLVARKYIFDNVNHESESNFERGSVRRIVTIGTPHFGSGFSNLLTFDFDNIGNCGGDSEEANLTAAGIARLSTLLSKGQDALDGNAIIEMSINSAFLNYLNSETRPVSSFAIIGDTGDNFVGFTSSSTGIIAGCSHDDIFNNENSDGVVSVVSALGTVSATNSRTFDADHGGMRGNVEIAEAVVELLNGEKSQFSDEVKPTPSKAETGSGGSGFFPFRTNDLKFRIFYFFDVVSNFLIPSAEAQTSSTQSVTLSVSNESPSIGEQVFFNATVVGTEVTSLQLIEGQNFKAPDNTAPFEWNFTLNNSASGQKNFKVVAIIDGEAVESNSVPISVKPDLTTLEEITFTPGTPQVLFPSNTLDLNLTGRFSDGINRNVTSAFLETIYSERIISGLSSTDGDSPSISIDADGKVTALEPGTAEVVATNNGQTASRRIIVQAVATNDADGDDLSDADETTASTDLYHPDSDGDGTLDNVEVGPNPSSALDADSDGTINALDASTVTVLTDQDVYVAAKTDVGALRNVVSQDFTDLETRPSPLVDVDMSAGLIDLTIRELAEGQTSIVTLTFSALPEEVDSFVSYGAQLPDTERGWYKFDGFERDSDKVTITLVDNGAGDSDSRAGVIQFTGGPGDDPAVSLAPPVVVTPPAPPESSSSSGGGCQYIPGSTTKFDPILPLSLLFALLYLFRRRRGAL